MKSRKIRSIPMVETRKWAYGFYDFDNDPDPEHSVDELLFICEPSDLWNQDGSAKEKE